MIHNLRFAVTCTFHEYILCSVESILCILRREQHFHPLQSDINYGCIVCGSKVEVGIFATIQAVINY